MNDQTDSQLLGAYAGDRSEAAFAELVRRHINFVHSAALRMVCDPHLAQDVTQGVFVVLATNASKLKERSVLSSWLHCTARNIAAQTVRTIERRRAREEEASAMNDMLAAGSEGDWEDIAPHLDAGLGELNDADRDAVFLRYFERKSAHEMAKVLGISEEAAQKRVRRAVEHLREFLAKRGIRVGASGLVLLISTNAVLLAPAGLGATVTALAVAAVATEAAVGSLGWLNAKAGAAILAAALIAGLTVYSLNRRRVAQFEEAARVALAEQEQMALAREEALAAANASQKQADALRREVSELPQLRSEVARLRNRIAMSQVRNDAHAEPALSAAELRTLLRDVDRMPEDVLITRSFQVRFRPKNPNALAALRARGTNLVPQLLELLRTENRDLGDVPHTEDTPFHDEGRFHRSLALQGFYGLGSLAAPAIPALLQFSATSPDDDAAYALAGIGRAAVPLLCKALSDPDAATRRRAVLALGLNHQQDLSVVEALAKCLRNPEERSDVRLAAILALSRSEPTSEQVLAALLEAFRDSHLIGNASSHKSCSGFDHKGATAGMEPCRLLRIGRFCSAFERHGARAKMAARDLREFLAQADPQETLVIENTLRIIDAPAVGDAR